MSVEPPDGAAPGVAGEPGAEVAVAVLARAPAPGHGKSRLVPLLGSAGAARLQERLLAHTLSVAGGAWTTAAGRRFDRVARVLWIDGALDHPQVEAARSAWCVVAQPAGDLGVRMRAAALDGLGRAAAVLVIGTDCPARTPLHLAEAAALLDRHEVVLQGALDGGYVMIGLAARAAAAAGPLFDPLPWGGTEVAGLTRQRCRALGLATAELPALADLDTPEDYRAAVARGELEDGTALAANGPPGAHAPRR